MQKQSIQAIIFDLDGVVIDTRTPIEEFWISWGKQKGIKIDEQTMHEKIHGRPAQLTLDTIFGQLTQKEKQEINLAGEEMERNLAYTLMPGVKELLQALKDQKIKTALVTSSLPEKVENVFTQLGLSGMFHEVITADQITHGKPAPDCYLLAAKKLNLSPASCLVFEDSASGVCAANKAGMKVIGVNEPIAEAVLKREGAAMIIPNFLEIKIENNYPKNSILFIQGSYEYFLSQNG